MTEQYNTMVQFGGKTDKDTKGKLQDLVDNSLDLYNTSLSQAGLITKLIREEHSKKFQTQGQ